MSTRSPGACWGCPARCHSALGHPRPHHPRELTFPFGRHLAGPPIALNSAEGGYGPLASTSRRRRVDTPRRTATSSRVIPGSASRMSAASCRVRPPPAAPRTAGHVDHVAVGRPGRDPGDHGRGAVASKAGPVQCPTPGRGSSAVAVAASRSTRIWASNRSTRAARSSSSARILPIRADRTRCSSPRRGSRGDASGPPGSRSTILADLQGFVLAGAA
jgi:hypothetical protein